MRHLKQIGVPVIVILIALFLMAQGCAATFTRDAYRSLVVSQQTYDAVLSGMGDLYREGKISDSQKNKAIDIGRAYKLAHNGAVESLARYQETGGEADKQAIIAGLAEASKQLAALVNYARPFLEGK